MIGRFSRPYAKAFMEIVPSATEAQKYHAELTRFDKARKSSPDLTAIVGNPGVALETKQRIIAEVAKRLELSDLSVRILDVVVRNQRINQLSAILEAWRLLINKDLGLAIAKVRAAHELSAEEREQLKRALESKTGKKVDLDVTTDPSLLGGFVAQVDSEVYDASIVGQIQRFQHAT
jgi:F-type H+-transporting ATPase subunit delta